MTLTLGEKAELALKLVQEAPLIAYDTEGTGLDWKVNQPVGYVITVPDKSLYIPIRHGGGNNLLDPNVGPMTAPDSPTRQHKFEKALAKAFLLRRQRGHKTVGHNLKFDMHFSANQGIMLGRECYDTGITQPMLDEFTKSFSLDDIAKSYGVTAKKGQPMYDRLAALFGGVADKKQMSNFWRLPGNDDIAVEYSEGDGITTLELHLKQMEQIREEEMEFIHSVESRLIWTVFRMERVGVKVDESVLAETIEKIERKITQAMQSLPANFNTRSPKDVRALMEGAGHTDWPTTPAGNPSFAEKWLKKYPEGRQVIEVRQMTNLLNSFVMPLKDKHMFKGRVYSSFNQLMGDEYGTISGRFSSSQPNMQQVPKHNKEVGPIFRRLFVPDEGKTFVEADYSQCEPRLFAHYSKEPSLLEGYNSTPPKDMHAVVAELFNVDRGTTAKRMNMGILTGMQRESFAGHMGLPLNEASQLFNQWFDFFPGIKDFQEQAKNVFKSRGYVKTILGRRCRLDHPRFAYRGTSRIIQGGNADIIKERTLAVDEFIEAEWDDQVDIFLTIHDATGWQADDDICDKVSAQMVEMFCQVQCDPYNLRVPFKMDVHKGRNWAEATYGV